jgi:hypothetical protein
MCEHHPHASTLPNSSKHYMRLDIGGKPAGLAVWGYGIVPKETPRHLFGEAGRVRDYLELCRFFVYDWCAKNTASKFLATTHRLIKKHAPHIKWLYTYAAGFQGMVGHIYKAAGYDYIGQQECSACVWVPDIGLVHWVAIWHRYHLPVGSGRISPKCWTALNKLWPGCRRWAGYNFRYIYWLCTKAEKSRLMESANFRIEPYPTEADLEIWTEDEYGNKTPIAPDFAKTIPIVKLPTKRAGSVASDTPANQAGEGGATPTPALSREGKP